MLNDLKETTATLEALADTLRNAGPLMQQAAVEIAKLREQRELALDALSKLSSSCTALRLYALHTLVALHKNGSVPLSLMNDLEAAEKAARSIEDAARLTMMRVQS